MLKKIFVTVLLMAFLINTMGYYFIFEISRYLVRKEVAEKASGKRAIQVIVIDQPSGRGELRWVDKKEFVYRGNLYDVIYASSHRTKTVYYCYHDRKEQRLLKVFQQINGSKLIQALWNHLIKAAIPAHHLELWKKTETDIEFACTAASLCFSLILPERPPP